MKFIFTLANTTSDSEEQGTQKVVYDPGHVDELLIGGVICYMSTNNHEQR